MDNFGDYIIAMMLCNTLQIHDLLSIASYIKRRERREESKADCGGTRECTDAIWP
jgi:hypothetical protein